MCPHSDPGVLEAPPGHGHGRGYTSSGYNRSYPPYTVQERQGYHYNNGGAFPHSRDIDYGDNSQYAYDMQYEPRSDYQSRHGTQVRHVDSNEFYERRDEADFNISTSNSFFPLWDLEGPYDNPYNQIGFVDPSRHLKPSTNGNLSSPSPSGQTQHWGFQRPTQGTKRPIDPREVVGEG